MRCLVAPRQSTVAAMSKLELAAAHTFASAKPVRLADPLMFSSFSFGEDRQLLLDDDHKDEALKWYRQPVLGLDLQNRFDEAVWRQDGIDEGLDALLESILHVLRDPAKSQAMGRMLRETAVITWRGMMTKILTCVYEESEGFEIDAMMVNGCLYLAEYKPPLSRKMKQDSQQKRQTYTGYAFESYCATDDPYKPQGTTQDECWSGDVNTNVQWAAVVRTALGDIPIILGGEVDCVANNAGLANGLAVSDFVELKTNMVLQGERDVARFERYKMLKHYVQSVLLGVPVIVVGFKDLNGSLAGFQSFQTLDIPSFVAEKPNAWHASACLNAGHHIISFVLNALSSSAHVEAFDNMPEDHAAPVFRIAFSPARRSNSTSACVSIRLLSDDEVLEIQASKANQIERAGFLPLQWLQAVRSQSSIERDASSVLNY